MYYARRVLGTACRRQSRIRFAYSAFLTDARSRGIVKGEIYSPKAKFRVSCYFLCASNEFDGSDLVRIRFGTPAGAQRRADFRVAFSIYWFLTGF